MDRGLGAILSIKRVRFSDIVRDSDVKEGVVEASRIFTETSGIFPDGLDQ
jgi:hypothetical protein